MISYPVKENPSSSAVSEILRYKQILLLYYKDSFQKRQFTIMLSLLLLCNFLMLKLLFREELVDRLQICEGRQQSDGNQREK